MYSVNFSSAARRLFKKLDKHIKDEILKQAERLAQQPMAGKPLEGKFRHYRSLHFSYKGVAYRIAYTVNTETQSVLILLADKRENFYKRLEESNS
jgi:mRNA-degrading endonuclease RelE of RelBE toxin-antitoxin system